MGGPTTHYGGAQGISLEGELFEERCELEEMDGEPYEQQCEHWELPEDTPNTEAHAPTDDAKPTNHAKRPSSRRFVFVELFSGLGAFTSQTHGFAAWAGVKRTLNPLALPL